MFCFHEKLDKIPFKHGILLQRLGHGENINAVHRNFQDGAVVDLYQHQQEQFGYIIKGSLDATIADETHRLRAGDAYFVPPTFLIGSLPLGKPKQLMCLLQFNK